jgi:hypothetical protein
MRHLNSNRLLGLGAALSMAVILGGCEGFFGEKTDISFIDEPIYNGRQVAYVPIQPVWDNFSRPIDVIAGYDELIYVADGLTNEIVGMDQAGNEVGRFPIPGLKAIAQDRTLDILALGTSDTTISGTAYSLATIYRLELKSSLGYGIQNAVIEKKMVHPFYFKISFKPSEDASDVFTGIATRADNQYYVTRNGTNNSTLQFGGPDDGVLLFNQDDEFVSVIGVSTSSGTFQNYFVDPSGVTCLAQPPQSPFVETDPDFIVSVTNGPSVLKVVYVDVQETETGISYELKQFTTTDTAAAENFLYTPNRFTLPTDVTYSGDGTNYLFVIDSEKDSLFQFTNTGLEGVQPPAGSESDKQIRVSFGGMGTGLMQFNDPAAVAYLNQIVYVADAGNARVLRFKLTTDFD